MYDRQYSASLVIACQGNQEPELQNTPYGEIRSRDGASLKFTKNDAKGIYQKWSRDNPFPPEAHIYLENPTKSEVEKALERINFILSKYPQKQTGIDVFFAGHGECPTGSLVLKDHNLTVKELLGLLSMPLNKAQGERGLGLMLDSCYSGSFLIDIVVELEEHNYGIWLFDAIVSSMHDEKSWELSFLEHGAFTFAFLNPGNQYLKKNELSRAIEKKDNKVIARLLQGMVGSMASSVAFLTQGRQHSIDCMKGLHFEVVGHGSFSLADLEETITREILISKFEKAKNEVWE